MKRAGPRWRAVPGFIACTLAVGACGSAPRATAPAGGRPPPGPAARAPAAMIPAYGVMAWRTNQLTRADFALIRRSGARLVRFNVLTSSNADRDPLGVRKYDGLVAAATAEGVELLPVLMRSRSRDEAAAAARRRAGASGPAPGARSPGGRGRGSARRGAPVKQVADPPATAAEWTTWRARVRAYAERFGPRGAFWREHPGLPYRPFRAWEVWNEPNLRQFWNGQPADPRAYARLLLTTRAVLRQVDPQARIVSAGLGWRYSGAEYLSAALDAAGGCAVDAIATHPYAPTPDRVMADLEQARAIADAHGARGVPIWTTEVGWRVGAHGYASVPDAAAQARAFDRLAADVSRRRSELRLGPTIAFALRDRVNPATGRVDNTAGLRRADDAPRPAWEVWSRWATGAPPLALPPARACGR